jgi:hypothetical protein
MKRLMKEVTGRIPLKEVLHDRSFEVEKTPELQNLNGVVETRISVTPQSVKSGERVLVKLSIKNAGDRPVDLSFVAHVGPMMDLDVTGPDSDMLVYPPPNPPPIARPGPPYAVGLTLLPEGEVFHEAEWVASSYEWSPGLEGPVPIPLRGYASSVRPVGPLASGHYRILVRAMFHYAGYSLEEPVGLLEVTD